MNGKDFSPPTVIDRVRLPPSATVAPTVTVRTAPGHLSMGTSMGMDFYSFTNAV
jgi:hypothetical protein